MGIVTVVIVGHAPLVDLGLAPSAGDVPVVYVQGLGVPVIEQVGFEAKVTVYWMGLSTLVTV